MSFVAPILRTGLRELGKQIYRGLRVQDRLIDDTYRKTGLYNRGVIRGVKHGLAGGQIIGGIASLGLNAPDTPGNGGSIPYTKRPKFTPRKSYQARRRFPTRNCPRNENDKYAYRR